ncbi:hypothetical protein K2173_017305 [Erythroxylum novogranatense]|uniref:Transmembrane 9 superfamily member n=1 Tax=Erythroxylum novogranatense TaxID=1862640 RepID=A0AAV8UA13_9ROSI|nr:hypothetical protein K2173_017305 [Erythroxylum novogranatense]
MRMFVNFYAFLLVSLYAHASNGVNLAPPQGFRRIYSTGDEVHVKVNSLTSISTIIPSSYYSLPYCKPLSGIRISSENLGQRILGDQIVNSPYMFRMNVNESFYLCTTSPLNQQEVRLLKQRTNDLYQVNMILDNLPVMRYAEHNGINIRWTGFPVGYNTYYNDNDYIINHLKFRVLINEHEETRKEIGMAMFNETAPSYEIVGFQVLPCSVKHDRESMSKLNLHDIVSPVNCPLELDKSQIIKERERVSFTYEVEFVKSEILWLSRWDAYLKFEGNNIHWFSILNSIGTLFIVTGVLLIRLLRMVRGRGESELKAQSLNNVEVPRWKLLGGDVFRGPENPELFCVMVGTGTQITVMAVVTAGLAALRLLSPASRGMLLTGMIYLYLFSGIIGGYIAVRLWRCIKGTSEEWKSISSSVACFLPGIVFLVLAALNLIHWGSNSTATISIPSFCLVLTLWFCTSVPLTILGGYFAIRAEATGNSMKIASVPREIPASKYPGYLLVLGAGLILFGILYVELFYIFSSIWFGTFYTAFSYLLIVVFLVLVGCVELSVLVTCIRLSVEDWRWWWKAFFASGSVSFYFSMFAISYLIFDLQGLSGPASTTLYLGYTLILATAIMLATGSIGFLASFYFVKFLYSSVSSALHV